MLRSIGVWVGVLVAVVVATGLSFREFSEYALAFRRQTADTIRDAAPLSLEAGRMDLLVERLDGRIAAQTKVVAKASVELEEAERSLAERRLDAQEQWKRMAQLRGRLDGEDSEEALVSVGCHGGNTREVERRLGRELLSYRARCEALEERERTVAVHRQTVDALREDLRDWQGERDQLAHRADMLRSRLGARDIRNHGGGAALDNSLDRAQAAADRVERRLRIAEKQTELVQESDLGSQPASRDVRSEFDALSRAKHGAR